MRRPPRARPDHLSTSLHSMLLALMVCACQGAEPVGERQDSITVPNGFTETVLTTGVSEPTALAFLPSGTILVTSRSGKIRVLKNGTTLLGTPAVDLTSRVCPERERGLLGI